MDVEIVPAPRLGRWRHTARSMGRFVLVLRGEWCRSLRTVATRSSLIEVKASWSWRAVWGPSGVTRDHDFLDPSDGLRRLPTLGDRVDVGPSLRLVRDIVRPQAIIFRQKGDSRVGHALPIATPIASTIAPPSVTTTSEERKLTCRKRWRTKAMANSSIATTMPATISARLTSPMRNGSE